MDWRCDGNLIAFGSNDHIPKIFDIRVGKAIKTYDAFFSCRTIAEENITIMVFFARQRMVSEMDL